LNAAHELKNLQTKVKATQEEKQARQAQLEPFQQHVKGMIVEMKAEKDNLEHVHGERRGVLT
jgi:hypothetical protein